MGAETQIAHHPHTQLVKRKHGALSLSATASPNGTIEDEHSYQKVLRSDADIELPEDMSEALERWFSQEMEPMSPANSSASSPGMDWLGAVCDADDDEEEEEEEDDEDDDEPASKKQKTDDEDDDDDEEEEDGDDEDGVRSCCILKFPLTNMFLIFSFCRMRMETTMMERKEETTKKMMMYVHDRTSSCSIHALQPDST